MRVCVRVVVIVALLATMSIVTTGGSAAARQSTIYLALGDSVQAGFEASVQSKGAVPQFFKYLDRVNAADRLVNLAVPGESSSSMQAGPNSQLNQALAVI